MNTISLEEVLKLPYKKPTIVAKTSSNMNKSDDCIKNWLTFVTDICNDSSMFASAYTSASNKPILEKA